MSHWDKMFWVFEDMGYFTSIMDDVSLDFRVYMLIIPPWKVLVCDIWPYPYPYGVS